MNAHAPAFEILGRQVLILRKLHLLSEKATRINGSQRNYSLWTFAARMNQAPQEKTLLRNLLLVLSFVYQNEVLFCLI